MNEQVVDTLFDLPKLEKQQAAVMKIIENYNKTVQNVKTVQVTVDGSTGSLQLAKNLKNLQTVQEDMIRKNAIYSSSIKVVNDQLKQEATQQDLNTKKKKDQIAVDRELQKLELDKIKVTKAKNDELRKEQDAIIKKQAADKKLEDQERKRIESSTKLTNAEKLEAQAILNKAGSYNQISAVMRLYQIQLKDMSEKERNSEFGQAVSEHINQLNSRLKLIDATMGNHQRNVGNYANSYIAARKIITDELEKVNKKIETGGISKTEFDNLKKQRDALTVTLTKTGGNFSSLTSASNAFTTSSKDLGKILGTNTSTFKAFDAEVAKTNKELGITGKTVKESHGAFGHLGGELKNTLLQFAGFYGIAETIKGFFEGVIEETNNAEIATAQLKNSLENVGRADLFDTLLAKADEFSNKFKALDDDEVKKVFTNLVDYGKLTETQMIQLTEVIINYAAKQRVTLPEATDVMTKALEGSAKGLKIYGINVKDAATVSDRFGIIMKDLAPKVKGAQAAFESTSKGWFAQMKEQFARFQEYVGKGITSLFNFSKSQHELAVQAKKEAEQGEILIKQYEELANKTNKTAAEKDKLKVIESQLVTIFGDSVLQINKQTGAYELNTEAVKEQIKQKLLLANNDAATLASKINARQEEKNALLLKETYLQDQLNASIKTYGMTLKQAQQEYLSGQGQKFREATAEEKQKPSFIITALKDQLDATREKIGNSKADLADLEKDLNELGFKMSDVNKLFTPPDPKKIIGGGNPDEDKAGGDKAENELKASFERAAQYRKQALEELNKYDETKLRIMQDQFRDEYGDEERAYASRLDSLQNFYDVSLSIIEKNKQGKLSVIQEEKEINLSKAKSEKERLAIIDLAKKKEMVVIQDSNREMKKAQLDFTNETFRITKQAHDKDEEAMKKHIAKMKQANDERIQIMTDQVDIQKNKDVINLLAEYSMKMAGTKGAEREKLEKDLQKKLLNIESAGSLARLMILEKELKIQLSVIQLLGGKTTDIEKLITENLRQQAEIRKGIRDGESKDADTDQNERLDKALRYEQAASEFVQTLVNRKYTLEKNKIQDIIETNDKKTAKEIENIEKSGLSDQEKQNKIAVLNQVNQAKKEQLEYKQRQLDIQRAKFEKANSILQLIAATAVAVMKHGGPTSPLGLTDLAFGLFQLASIIATPIPRFKDGLDYDYEGPGWVNDGDKREAIVRADGTLELPKQKNKLEYFKRGDRVIPDADLLMNSLYSASMGDMLLGYGVDNKEDRDMLLAQVFSSKIDDLNSTVKNKPVSFVNITRDGFEHGFIKANGRTIRLNSHINF